MNLEVAVFESRPPYMKFTFKERLGRPECPYIERWTLNLGRLGSLRLHHWLSSDDSRALHDHPNDFITLVLRGHYDDVTDDGIERMTPGTVRLRKAEHKHYVQVPPGGCWTLLYFWPRRRNWGFWINGKFKKANKYFYERGQHPCDTTPSDRETMRAFWYHEITAQDAARALDHSGGHHA